MMSAPTNLCKTLSYTLQLEPDSQKTGITQVAQDCSNSIDCQTVIFDTSQEKVLKFRFIIKTNAQPGFEKLTTQILTQNIVCGAEVQEVSTASLTYVYDRNSGIKTIDFEKDELR